MLFKEDKWNRWNTKIGRYCYDLICRNHEMIESIGSFSSFVAGVDVVPNHPMKYLTTYPMLYAGYVNEGMDVEYYKFKDESCFFDGVVPKRFENRKRIRIGNDVWLGKNVIVIEDANIGNGVIAGAGAIITKDIPDYAVVVGVSAKIIGYRYTVEAMSSVFQL